MVGWVVGWSAPWVVWPFQVVVVLAYGGLWAGGVGWWAVVVVAGVVLGVVVAVVVVVGVAFGMVVVVVVVVGVMLVVVVVVVELVVVVVLWARPQDPLALRSDMGVGHRLLPFGPHGLVDSGGGFGAGLGKDRSGGVPRPRVGFWGRDGRAFADGDVAAVWTGSCCVAASVLAVPAGGRGARDAVGVGSWWRGRFSRCRPFCACLGCVCWCWWCWWCSSCCGGSCCCWHTGSGRRLDWGFGLGTGSSWKRTSSRRCGGSGAGQGCCCRGRRVPCVVVRAPPAGGFATAALTVAVALWVSHLSWRIDPLALRSPMYPCNSSRSLRWYGGSLLQVWSKALQPHFE